VDEGCTPLVTESFEVLDAGTGVGKELPMAKTTSTGARFRRRDRLSIAEHVRDS
jgi:hypothetical protein